MQLARLADGQGVEVEQGEAGKDGALVSGSSDPVLAGAIYQEGR